MLRADASNAMTEDSAPSQLAGRRLFEYDADQDVVLKMCRCRDPAKPWR